MISVIVPFYGVFDTLRPCLGSLQNQYYADFEVLLVNDGSPEPLPHWLSQLERHWPRLTVLQHPQNRGRAVSRNTGLHQARGRWLLFLDADMWASPELLQAHVHFHQARGPGWIAQGLIQACFADLSTQRPDTLPASSLWTDASRAFFATGNVSVERRQVLELGGFDEDFSEYGWEDLELGLRLKQRGLRSSLLPEARSLHREVVPSQQNWQENVRKEQARGRGAVQLFKKHPRLEVRLMAQLTPLHGLLNGIMPALGSESRWLERLYALEKQRPHLALALYRALLNRHCFESTRATVQKAALPNTLS